MNNPKYYKEFLNFFKVQKRMPSYREIAKIFKFKSKNAAYKLAEKMIGQNFIAKDAAGKLLPGELFGKIPVLGTVTAGWPSPAEEELVDVMSLDEYLVRKQEATYLLKVDGDSMIDAGILPGDLVLVERTNVIKDGDIVIAEVDNEWTMKYFKKSGQQTYLQPGNKKYQAIIPKQELKISAVVRAVIRKLS